MFRLFPFTLWKRFSRRSERLRSLDAELSRRGYSFQRLEELVGYSPRNEELFVEALLHRSFLPYLETPWVSNERLEFLGDSVLNLVVAEHLYRELPEVEEGHLTKARARLVNRHILADTGRALGLPSLLLMSMSAQQAFEQGSESMVSDSVESVIGAIYLDAGLERARAFIHRTILDGVDPARLVATDDNHKSALLELSQRRGLGMPRYEVLHEAGPEHDREFTVEVRIGDRSMGTGTGKSKKAAEQAAAAQALRSFHSSHD